jgi:rhodanese-related sulfurtransferase
VTAAEVAAAIRGGTATVANVLPRAAYEQAHIPGSVNLPLEEIPERAGSVLPDRSAPTIVYCAGGPG